MMNEHEFKTAYRASENSVPVNNELKQRLIEMAKEYDFKDEDNTQSVKVVKLENIKKSDAEKKRVRRNVMKFMALAACFIICATSIPQVSKYMNTGEVDPEVVVESTTPAPGKADENDTPANNVPDASGGTSAASGSNVSGASGGPSAASGSNVSGASGGPSAAAGSVTSSGSSDSGASSASVGSGRTSGSNGSGGASGTGSRNETSSSDDVMLDAVQNPFAGSEMTSDNTSGGGMADSGVSLNGLAHGNNAANQNASGNAEPGKDTDPNTEPGKDTDPNTEPGKDIAPSGEEKTTRDEFNGVFDSLANQRNKLSVWDSEISPFKNADEIIGSYYEKFTERKTEYLKTADEFEEKYSEAAEETEYSEAVNEYNDTLSEDSELYDNCRELYRKSVNYIEMNEIELDEPDSGERSDEYETETDIPPAEEYKDIAAQPEETYTKSIDLTEISTETDSEAETDTEMETDSETETDTETDTDAEAETNFEM